MSMPTEADQVDVSHHSVAFERMAEAAFLSDLLQEMWFVRREVIDVLHSTVDAFGYDLVLWNRGVTRHVQLKTRSKTARTASYNLATQLRDLPAACVVVIEWERLDDANRMELTYRWFGGGPHERIPDWGTRSPGIPRPTRWASKGSVKDCAVFRSGGSTKSPQCQNSPSGSSAHRRGWRRSPSQIRSDHGG